MIITITPENFDQSVFSKDDIADFLVKSLGPYGDERHHAMKCLDYTLSDESGKGGLVTIYAENDEIVGAVVINKTGMDGYIPENILVYIAVSPNQRGKGTGRKLMEEVIAKTDGDIALHVEPHNPAVRLYERLGFTNKYLEMRLKK